MGVNRFSPGCGCCGCVTNCYDCVADELSTVSSDQIDVVVSGLPVDFTFWRFVQNNFTSQYEKITVYDFDTSEGTYSVSASASCSFAESFTPVSLSYDQEIINPNASACPTSSPQSGTTDVVWTFDVDLYPFSLSVSFPGLHDYIDPNSFLYSGTPGWSVDAQRVCFGTHPCDYEDYKLVLDQLSGSGGTCISANSWSGTDSTFV